MWVSPAPCIPMNMSELWLVCRKQRRPKHTIGWQTKTIRPSFNLILAQAEGELCGWCWCCFPDMHIIPIPTHLYLLQEWEFSAKWENKNNFIKVDTTALCFVSRETWTYSPPQRHRNSQLSSVHSPAGDITIERQSIYKMSMTYLPNRIFSCTILCKDRDTIIIRMRTLYIP